MTKKLRWKMVDAYATRSDAEDLVEQLEGRGDKAKAQYSAPYYPRPWLVFVDADSDYRSYH